MHFSIICFFSGEKLEKYGRDRQGRPLRSCETHEQWQGAHETQNTEVFQHTRRSFQRIFSIPTPRRQQSSSWSGNQSQGWQLTAF